MNTDGIGGEVGVEAPCSQRPAMTFEEAKRVYVHRYTMEHIPAWALQRPCDQGGTETRYYAPQYASDREWFEKTLFPPHNPFAMGSQDQSCYSARPSWPFGQWLDAPYRRH